MAGGFQSCQELHVLRGAEGTGGFGKAHHLSEEVHMAMVSRGYRGDAKTIQSFRLTSLDAVAATIVLATAVVIIGGDHLVGR